MTTRITQLGEHARTTDKRDGTIRDLTTERDEYKQRMQRLMQTQFAITKERDALMAAGKLALETPKQEPVEAPDIKALQAEGKGPAPCARFCESNAFEIEIRKAEQLCISESTLRDNIIRGLLKQVEALTAERDKLTEAAGSYKVVRDTLTARLNLLEAAGKLALEALDDWYYGANQDRPKATFYVALQALKAAGVTA